MAMIDQCIIKVYKKDQKVFIPDFGAIIHSEDSDKHYFNQHLTFDDGKLVKEIIKKEKITDEEAREKLETYISRLKKEIESNKPYLLDGIGYLQLDDRGDIVINETQKIYDLQEPVAGAVLEEPDPPTEAKEHIQDQQESDEIQSFEEPLSEEDTSEADTAEVDTDPNTFLEPDLVEDEPTSLVNESDSTPAPIIEEPEEGFVLGQLEGDPVIEEPESIDKSDYPPDEQDEDEEELPQWVENDEGIRENDEKVMQYYKKKEELENRGSGKSALWFAVPVILIILAATYYFKIYDGQKNFVDQFKSVFTSEEGLSADNKPIDEDIDEENPEGAMTNISSEISEQKSTDNEDIPDENHAPPEENIVDEQTESSQEQTNPETPKVEESEVEDVSVVQNLDSEGKTYQVILGSFKLESNADSYLEVLQSRGHKVTKFRGDNDFHFIGFDNIESKSKALAVLREMRNDHEPQAWIVIN